MCTLIIFQKLSERPQDLVEYSSSAFCEKLTLQRQTLPEQNIYAPLGRRQQAPRPVSPSLC